MLSAQSRALALMLLCLTFPAFLNAQSLEVERVLTGLAQPIFATYAPGDGDRLYIVQRAGAIRVLNLNTGNLNGANFITVPGVDTFFEGGLFSIAFHPDFENNGFFYVHYTDTTGNDTRVVRFTATNSDTASTATAQNIIEINQPQGNHNGGFMAFGPDGYLYVGIGDGGNANDTGAGHTAGIGNSQDITNNLLGKMLRLDIDGDDFPADGNRNYAIPPTNPFVGVTGDDEIFLYGLRNPFRCSFDRLTGDLYIGDVGQNSREEINLFPAAGHTDYNMGWRLREGTIQTPAGGIGGPRPDDNVEPIYDYLRTGQFGGSSVTGGYVYRGPIQGLRGNYFFTDFNSNNLWSFRFDGSDPASFNGENFSALFRWNSVLNVDAGTISSVASFGEDLEGNLYLVDLFGGELFKIVGGSLFEDGTLEPPVLPFAGILESGSFADLASSDDSALRYRAVTSTPSIQLGFRGSIATSSPSVLVFKMENRVTTPNVTQTIEVFNFITNSYEVFDTRTGSTSDQEATVEINDATNYAGALGNIDVRVTWNADGTVTHFPWGTAVDQVSFQFID